MNDFSSADRREANEKAWIVCPYLAKRISYGLCYDMQMIGNAYSKPSALPEITIDKDKLKSFCKGCEYEL